MNLSQRSGEKVVARKNDVLAIEETVAGDGGNAAEFARRRPDRELLRELTDETGGTVDPAVAQVAARRGRTRPVQERIDWLLIPCAIALVIGDVAIRRRNPAA
jgi:hypothetical protein